jgi:pyruvate/2-oxoglutarate dehydrogenase complex dihydrolipoamide dehydrogenase (E3) component
LHALGIKVTLIEKLPQVTPGLDDDMTVYVQEYLHKQGITVYTSEIVQLPILPKGITQSRH